MSEDELNNFGWTVEYFRDLIPFPNFAAAVSYADALVLKGTLVKVIDPLGKRITVVSRQENGSHSDEIIDELAGSTRRRRGAD
jgi:hypothetical protein